MTSDRSFFAVSALLFLGSAAVTVLWCVSMPMHGGGTMAMAAMAWPAAGFSFLAMWLVMMAAMMLPSLVPMLARYRRAVAAPAGPRLDGLTALAGLGYFFVWTVLGAAVFALRAALEALEMQLPAIGHAAPVAVIAVIVIAGAFQFTPAKARALACCREAPKRVAADAAAAWRHGLRLGLHCAGCCANLTAILLVAGMMNLTAMIALTAAITAERLMPAGPRVARAIGTAALVAGVFLTAQALAV